MNLLKPFDGGLKKGICKAALSGFIIWYSGLVWTRTMHKWPLAIHWQLGFSWKRVCIF